MRDFLAWARATGLLLVNIDEVFHAEAPMPLNDIYRMELAKHLGLGFAAAADIARLAFLDRFGGVYTDDDNMLRSLWQDLLGEIAETFDDAGFALHRDGSRLSNAAMLMARGHPFARAYLGASPRTMTSPRRSSWVWIEHATTRAGNEMWTWPALRARLAR
jgi:hypothetical protein